MQESQATYATIATDIDASVTDICSQDKKVRSLAKYTLGSTFTGTYKNERNLKFMSQDKNDDSRTINLSGLCLALRSLVCTATSLKKLAPPGLFLDGWCDSGYCIICYTRKCTYSD